MKKTVKIILAMLLVICMVAPTFVMSVSAEIVEGSIAADKVAWTYDTTTQVVTVTSTGGSYIQAKSRDNSTDGWGTGRLDTIKEVVIKNGAGTYTNLSGEVFINMPALTKVTIPATVKNIGVKVFTNSPMFKELVVEGNAYIPGAVDMSNITSPTLNTENHRTFEWTYIDTLILAGGVYNDSTTIAVYPVVDFAASRCSLGYSLKTIMGPQNDTYLRSFAAENGYDYVPYGKIGAGTAWTYDEESQVVTIYGNGTSSVLTALSSDDAEFLNDATTVVIRGDIISIEAGALAGLTALENVKFEGNVPAAAADPFGGKTVTFYKSHTATTSAEGYWADKTVIDYSGEYEGTIPSTTPTATYKNIWEYDIVTKTLTISNASTNGARLQTGTADMGGWSAYVDKIEKIVLAGRFERITENGFRYHTALETVILNSKEDYGTRNPHAVCLRAFAESTKLSTIALSGHAYIPGVADLSEGSTSTGNTGLNIFNASDSYNSTFMNTAIKGIILPFGAPTLNANHLPKELESVIVRYDDPSLEIHKAFCQENGYDLLYYGKMNNNTITWTYDENTKALSIYGTGALTTLVLPNDVTDVDTLYIDEGITSINETVFKKLSSFGIDGVDNSDKAGVAVRYEGYNGLRNIYDFNNGVSDVLESFGYSLVEFGAILVSSNKLAASELSESDLVVDPVTLEANVDGAVKKEVWSNGAWTGKVLSYVEGVETTFAVTLTNYTNNWDSGVYSRAYAVYEDASGTRTVVYADNGSAVSLYDAMVSGCQQGVLAGKVCEDVAVWNVLETGKVADLTVTGATAMVINGKDASADTKVLVVRGADGAVADEATIDAAKEAATTAGYTVDSVVIALAFTSAT